MKYSLARVIASTFYIGFIPGAPGTYASLATVIAFFLINQSYGELSPLIHFGVLCLITLIGVPAASIASKKSGVEDPSWVVIDEVAGQWLAFLFIPFGWLNLIIGFAAFRVFDIWKPWPIRKLESLPGGVGIMADDLLAGVYACAVLLIINFVWSAGVSPAFLQ